MAYFGGNPTAPKAEMNAAGTKQQKAHGITDDTPERFAADKPIRGGHGLNADPPGARQGSDGKTPPPLKNGSSRPRRSLLPSAGFAAARPRARGHGPCDGSPVGIEIMRVLGERAEKGSYRHASQ